MNIHTFISDEDKIYKHSNLLLGTLILLCSSFFVLLSIRKEIPLSLGLSLAISLYGILTAILCFCARRNRKIRLTSIITLSIFISLMGSFQQMSISILFIIPIYLGYFLQNRKKIYFVLFLNIFLFNVSRIFKSINIYHGNPDGYNLRLILSSNLISSVIESIIFLAIAIPIFMLLIKQNTDLRETLEEKDAATNDILQFCSTATSFHNKYLSVHIKGVRDITKVILDALIEDGVYIEPYYYDQIVFSVQFHDIGKIYIDSSILDKNGSLSIDEFNLIKEHPQRGLELFSLLPKNVIDENYIATCKNVIYQHHERLDGKGYPTGTTDISFEAKIVAVADVVDALLSWRPYKPPLNWDKLVDILEKQKSGFNYECLKAVYASKEKILAISDQNNLTLKNLLSLDDTDIIRQ
ncbi:MAG: HD domain-containing protein [Treponema sp.]|nr:HD domain-containing protein [Treponema sp.]